MLKMMEEALVDDNEIFVYMGGDQEVPDRVRRARIHESVNKVLRGAFRFRRNLIYVEFHDGVEIVDEDAFYGCCCLKSIKLLGVRIIKGHAFCHCYNLVDVEFGDQLETVEQYAFKGCPLLKSIRMQSVKSVGISAFADCKVLSDVECGEGLRTLRGWAFTNCPELERIALPLKDGMIESHVFFPCTDLITIDVVGGIHQTVASLHMESWRNEMINEIKRINQTLPTITQRKTENNTAVDKDSQ